MTYSKYFGVCYIGSVKWKEGHTFLHGSFQDTTPICQSDYKLRIELRNYDWEYQQISCPQNIQCSKIRLSYFSYWPSNNLFLCFLYVLMFVQLFHWLYENELYNTWVQLLICLFVTIAIHLHMCSRWCCLYFLLVWLF